MSRTQLRAAYADFLAVADQGGFGPPPAGEWDAARLLAHIYVSHAHITATALAVAAGHRPACDNRASLDEWNLRRVIAQAGDLPGLLELIRGGAELLYAVADHLSEDSLDVPVHVLIVSNDEVVIDEPWPLRQLVYGIATIHLPRHTEQLRGLLPVGAAAGR